jgi:hypothetical protein
MKIKRILKIFGIVVASIVVLFIGLIVLAVIIDPQPTTSTAKSTYTAVSTMTTARPTATARSIVPTAAPTKVAVVTNGDPQLGGPLSDFTIRYGKSLPQSAQVTAFVDPTDNGPLLHGGVLEVTYNAHNVVTYITYAGPDNWTRAKYKAMMLTFIPSDAVVNTQAANTADLIAYTSPSIGKFDEQFTNGVVGIYTV